MKTANTLFTARKPEQPALLLSVSIVLQNKMHRNTVSFYKLQVYRRVTNQVIKTLHRKIPHGDDHRLPRPLHGFGRKNPVGNEALLGKSP